MDRKLEDLINQRVDQYLVDVAEHNLFAIPEALFRTYMLRLTLMLLGSFISNFDDSLKHLEDEFRTLLKKKKSND